jgi:transposase
MGVQNEHVEAPKRPPAAVAAGGLVVDPPDVTRMLALQQHGWGAKRIAKELGIARGTVRRYLRLGGYKPYVRRKKPRSLTAHLPWLKQRFHAVRGNARLLQRELAGRGVKLGYSTIARVVKPWREELAARARATVRFETPAGQQMQCDFGELRVQIAGVTDEGARLRADAGVLAARLRARVPRRAPGALAVGDGGRL